MQPASFLLKSSLAKYFEGRQMAWFCIIISLPILLPHVSANLMDEGEDITNFEEIMKSSMELLNDINLNNIFPQTKKGLTNTIIIHPSQRGPNNLFQEWPTIDGVGHTLESGDNSFRRPLLVPESNENVPFRILKRIHRTQYEHLPNNPKPATTEGQFRQWNFKLKPTVAHNSSISTEAREHLLSRGSSKLNEINKLSNLTANASFEESNTGNMVREWFAIVSCHGGGCTSRNITNSTVMAGNDSLLTYNCTDISCYLINSRSTLGNLSRRFIAVLLLSASSLLFLILCFNILMYHSGRKGKAAEDKWKDVEEGKAKGILCQKHVETALLISPSRSGNHHGSGEAESFVLFGDVTC